MRLFSLLPWETLGLVVIPSHYPFFLFLISSNSDCLYSNVVVFIYCRIPLNKFFSYSPSYIKTCYLYQDVIVSIIIYFTATVPWTHWVELILEKPTYNQSNKSFPMCNNFIFITNCFDSFYFILFFFFKNNCFDS